MIFPSPSASAAAAAGSDSAKPHWSGTIEERKAYLEWRQKRDIVFGKPGAGQPANDRKPIEYKDKVLERALEYLRQELDKQKSS